MWATEERGERWTDGKANVGNHVANTLSVERRDEGPERLWRKRGSSLRKAGSASVELLNLFSFRIFVDGYVFDLSLFLIF
jgi:hypothetical protein